MRTVLAVLAILPIACTASASPVPDPSDAIRAMRNCGEKVGGSMARRSFALNKILAAVDSDCAREEAALEPFEQENLLARQTLLLRLLELGADARQEFPPGWSSTGVRVIH